VKVSALALVGPKYQGIGSRLYDDTVITAKESWSGAKTVDASGHWVSIRKCGVVGFGLVGDIQFKIEALAILVRQMHPDG